MARGSDRQQGQGREVRPPLPKRLTLPEEFDKGERIKAFMGWDGFAVMDGGVDVVDMCTRYVEAVQKESCGRCIPCRVGTRIILDTS